LRSSLTRLAPDSSTKALDLNVPDTLLARADEVLE